MFYPVAPALLICDNNTKCENRHNQVVPHEISLSSIDTIFWQHLGNGNFNNESSYKSLRVHRPRKFHPAYNTEQTINIKLNNEHLKKGDYEIKYKIAFDPIDSYFIPKVGYSLKKSDTSRPIVKLNSLIYKDWNSYTKKIRLNSETSNLDFVIELNGRGSVFIDDLFFSKVSDSSQLITSYSWEGGHDLPEVFFENNDLKYYASEIIKSKNEILKSSFMQITSQEQLKPDSIAFRKSVRYGESIKTFLFDKVYWEIPLALLGNDKNTFPLPDLSALKGLTNELTKIRQNDNLNDESISLRIGNVINAWNVIDHFFPYFDEIDNPNWEKKLQTSISECYKLQENYLDILKKLFTPLNDAHIFVDRVDEQTSAYPGIYVRYIENRVIVTNAISKYQNLIGQELIAKNGVPAGKIHKEYLDLISYKVDNYGNDNAARQILVGNWNKVSKYLFKDKNNKVSEYDIRNNIVGNRHSRLKDSFSKNKKSMYQINDDCLYMDLTEIDILEFRNALEKISKYKKLILDFRGYPQISGEDSFEIISHFLSNVDSTKWLFIPQIIKPRKFRSKTEYLEKGYVIEPKEPAFQSSCFLLINHEAISYSESIIGFYEKMRNVTTVGSPTTGSNGNVSYVSLPGGYYFRFTGMKVLKHDGSRLHGIGFLPDVEVKPTIQGIIEGRDEVLEKAIELASAAASTSKARKENKD